MEYAIRYPEHLHSLLLVDSIPPTLLGQQAAVCVTFPFFAFAVIVVSGPRFGSRTLPGKLMHRIPQRFDTGMPAVGLGILSTFVEDESGPGQRLQAHHACVARRIIANFSEQTRIESSSQ